MELMQTRGPIPPVRGRGRTIYPLRTMAVDQFFFIPGKDSTIFPDYLSRQGRKLKRKFVSRRLFMVKGSDGLWAECGRDAVGATWGTAVYRVE